MTGRILTKDLDARLVEVERKLNDMAERLARLDGRLIETKQQAQFATDQAHMANGNGHRDAEAGRIEEIVLAVSRLDERVEKITHTLVAQASRWT
jgi:hypothetical protein